MKLGRSMKLAVCIPCHVFVAPQMAQSLARMCSFYRGSILGPRFFENAVSTFGRNELVRWARDDHATHVLWIDTDSVFPPNAADRLLSIGLPFIGANFALKDGSGLSSAWGFEGERLEQYSTVSTRCASSDSASR